MSLTSEKLTATLDEIKEFYLTTNRTIILANSLGKDSMTVLELFMLGLKDIPPSKRRNFIYIESVDTFVEAPPMADYIKMQIKDIKAKIAKMKLPMKFVQLRPEITHTFFVNVIGKGYKTPDQSMRWCTDRLKIKPTNLFLKSMMVSNDGVFTVTGQRSDESLNRAHTLQKYTLEGKIQKDGSNPKNLIYTPIKDWTTEEVWNFLKANQVMTNDKIEKLYEDGSANKDVFAGNRMGCWCCTVVENDKALEQFLRTWL